MSKNIEHWDYVIEPKSNVKFYNFGELSHYKDLISLFVKRDFVSLYKQTILGPVWVVLQPVLTTIVFTVVFGKIAQIDTGVPSTLFYLLGILCWTYYADCVTKTSETFVQNQNIFGKVYFPRLVVPLSIVATNLIKFVIQLIVFLGFYIGFVFYLGDARNFNMSLYLLLVPLAVLLMAMLGMGSGLIIAALTTKYKDLRFLIQFAIQLGLYVTIIIPLNSVAEKYQWILLLNPMAGIIEIFKLAMFGENYAVFSWLNLIYCCAFSLLILMLGVRVFRKVERTFMDTI